MEARCARVAARVSVLIAAGVSVKVVSERLGHAPPRFTIDRSEVPFDRPEETSEVAKAMLAPFPAAEHPHLAEFTLQHVLAVRRSQARAASACLPGSTGWQVRMVEAMLACPSRALTTSTANAFHENAVACVWRRSCSRRTGMSARRGSARMLGTARGVDVLATGSVRTRPGPSRRTAR